MVTGEHQGECGIKCISPDQERVQLAMSADCMGKKGSLVYVSTRVNDDQKCRKMDDNTESDIGAEHMEGRGFGILRCSE